VSELIGYARCSTVLQDLTAQRQALAALGVPDDRIYLDKGLTGTSRARPGLDQALAAVRTSDTLVVPKLDRLARSVPDARHIGDSLVARGIKLSLGGTIYDPADPLGKMFFNILATFAERDRRARLRLRPMISFMISVVPPKPGEQLADYGPGSPGSAGSATSLPSWRTSARKGGGPRSRRRCWPGSAEIAEGGTNFAQAGRDVAGGGG